MADNLTLNTGSGGSDLRTTEDASSKHHQHIILEFDDGTTTPVALVGGTGVDAGGVLRVSLATDIALPAGTNTLGNVSLLGSATSGGTTIDRLIDVDEADKQIKGTAGMIYWFHAMNLSASVLYLKFYNATAASVSVGTTTPALTFPLPTQGTTNGAGFTLSVPNGIVFDTAITVAATTGIADADTGAPGTNEVCLNIGYA